MQSVNLLALSGHSCVLDENIEDTLRHYDGFGKQLFSYLKENNKEVYEKLIFFRNSEDNIPDIYALYTDINRPFAIQLDPDCETIIIWSHQSENEFGSWEILDYAVVNNFINTLLL